MNSLPFLFRGNTNVKYTLETLNNIINKGFKRRKGEIMVNVSGNWFHKDTELGTQKYK